MKGKKIFTTVEAMKIKKLIRRKLVSDKETQKKIRNSIRALGFYITDFINKKKYTTEDFERFVTIID